MSDELTWHTTRARHSYMEFVDVLHRRRMCRSFTTDPLPRSTLDGLLSACLHVPSAGHSQGRHLLVLHGRREVARYFDATLPDRSGFPWPGLLNAAALVVFCSDASAYQRRYAEPDKDFADGSLNHWGAPMWHIDTAFCAMTLLLGATNAGLGALFFGIFPAQLDAVRREFSVPQHLHPIGTVALGTPADDVRPSHSVGRGWKPLDELTTWGGWGHD